MNNERMTSKDETAWILQGLPVERGLEVVKEAYFDWMLQVTGYKERESYAAQFDGLSMTYDLSVIVLT